MSPENDDIEARIRRFGVQAGAEMRRRTLSDALAAHKRPQDAGPAAMGSVDGKAKTTSDSTAPVVEALQPARKGKNIKTLQWLAPAAAAACIVAGLLLWIAMRPTDPGQMGEAPPKTPSVTEEKPGTPSQLTLGGKNVRRRSTQKLVVEADLIIRAKLVSRKETPGGAIYRYKVLKVLKGKVRSEVVKGRSDPGSPVGTELVVFLKHSQDSAYRLLRAVSRRLDESEAEILDLVRQI